MKEIVIISGKGGTGKTSITAALATAMKRVVIADCDVDASDFHLISDPRVLEKGEFFGNEKAVLDPGLCERCGVCYSKCAFDAVKYDPSNEKSECRYSIDPFACEGCGVCAYFCPAGAIELRSTAGGMWFVSETRFGTLVHARLEPGGDNSGMLVTLIREKAKRIAEREHAAALLIDGSPGIGCPVIASLTGADFALIITEPTVSGLHDLRRVAELVRQFSIPAAICVNKYDLNPEMADVIEQLAIEMGMRLFERIPFDRNVIDAIVHKKSILEHKDGPARKATLILCGNISEIV